MPYVPNATDPTQPTSAVDASTAAAEFTTLKTYILGLALAAGMFSPVRQCANDGIVDASGNPAFLVAAGAGGLALDLKATGRPLVANFAGGSTGTGVSDRNGTYTADTANIVTGLAPSSTSYIFADWVSAGVWTWQSTLAPPQYGKIYPQSVGSVLQFGGAAGSTVFLDDFGNTWTAQGGAKVQTNQFKFGTGGLGGGGAANVLNGATDYVKSTSITSLGGGGWALRTWVYPTALPGSGALVTLEAVTNAGGFGASLDIFNNAGTIKFSYALSSNGSSIDIANNTQGTTTPLVNTWYFVELTYDALAGVYRLYVGGIQEASTASALRICNGVNATCGARGTASTFLTGYIDKPEILTYCQHPNGTAYAVPAAAPSITAVGYAPDFFDTQAMKMYQVTAASGVAGVAPTLTSKYRCYFGEADTSGIAPTAVRPYAFNGKYISADTTIPAVGTRTVFAANLGTNLVSASAWLRNYTADANYLPGEVEPAVDNSTAPGHNPVQVTDKNTLGIITGATAVFSVPNKTTGATANITTASWKMFIKAQRDF